MPSALFAINEPLIVRSSWHRPAGVLELDTVSDATLIADLEAQGKITRIGSDGTGDPGTGATIRYVGTGGDYATLAAAQTDANEGDIILLLKGETFLPTAIWRNRITIGAWGNAAVGEDAPIITGTQTSELTVTGNEVTIQDINFKDFISRGIAGTNAQGLQVKRCWFSGGTSTSIVHAIGLNNCNHSIVEDCRFFDIASHKYTDRDARNFSVVQFFYTDDCIFRRNDVGPGGAGVMGNIPGLNVYRSKRTIVVDNDFHDCMLGVNVIGSAGSVIHGNKIHDGSGAGITVGSMVMLGGEPVDAKSGTYNAATNTPDLESGSGVSLHDWWEVTTAGDFYTEPVAVGTLLQATVAGANELGEWEVLHPAHDITISGNEIWNLLRGLGTWNGIDIFVSSDRLRVEGNTVRGVNKHCLAFDHYGPKVVDQSTDDARWFGNHFDARTNTPQDETLVKYSSSGTGYQGLWDASSGSFPTQNLDGDPLVTNNNFVVKVPGTVDGVDFEYGDQLNALVNTPSSSTYSGNWEKKTGGEALPFAFTMAPSATNPATIQFECDLNTYYPNPDYESGDVICKHGRYTDGFTHYSLPTWQAHCVTSHDGWDGRSVVRSGTDVFVAGPLIEGNTNNEVSIQAAIDACHDAGGGQVAIPWTGYDIQCEAPIVLRPNVTLTGLGLHKPTLKFTWEYSNADTHGTYPPSDGLDHTGHNGWIRNESVDNSTQTTVKDENIGVSNLILKGPLGADPAWGAGIPGVVNAFWVHGYDQFKIDGVEVTRGGINANISHGDNLTITDCRSYQMARGGWNIYSTNGNVEGIIIDNVHGYNHGDDLIGIHGFASNQGGVGPSVVTDITTTEGSVTITCPASGSLSAANVGDWIIVKEAGEFGLPLDARVVTVNSATSVDLDIPASVGTTGKNAVVDFKRCSDIVINNCTLVQDTDYTAVTGGRLFEVDAVYNMVASNCVATRTKGPGFVVQRNLTSATDYDFVCSKNVSMTNCVSSDGEGGGVYVDRVLNLQLKNITVQGASGGEGIYIRSSSGWLDGFAVSGTVAEPGIYIDGRTKLSSGFPMGMFTISNGEAFLNGEQGILALDCVDGLSLVNVKAYDNGWKSGAGTSERRQIYCATATGIDSTWWLNNVRAFGTGATVTSQNAWRGIEFYAVDATDDITLVDVQCYHTENTTAYNANSTERIIVAAEYHNQSTWVTIT